MEWLKIIIGSIVTSGTVVTIILFIGRESIKKLLDRQLEKFKHTLDIKAKHYEITLKSQIEFKEKQLSEFYGPIYAILKRGRTIIHPYWIKGKLDQIDNQLRELSINSNNLIVNIILNKSHLIEGDKIPPSFLHYLSHVAIWHSYLDTELKGVPYSQIEMPEAYYPIEFEKEIFKTTENLKKELYKLYNET